MGRYTYHAVIISCSDDDIDRCLNDFCRKMKRRDRDFSLGSAGIDSSGNCLIRFQSSIGSDSFTDFSSAKKIISVLNRTIKDPFCFEFYLFWNNASIYADQDNQEESDSGYKQIAELGNAGFKAWRNEYHSVDDSYGIVDMSHCYE